jgi:sigma-B regulation protein RsbU (phosphoserine phosphatase)
VSAQPQRVLVIEDNQGDVDLVRSRLLESNSELEVSYADRLSTGLAALTRERPAAVLLDLYLPDSCGAETFHNVLNQAPGVAVVVLSGRDDEELAVNAVQHGVQDYLVKGTFDSKQLGRILKCAIERQALMTALNMNWKEQLQLKEHFLSHVSDELRTPLNSIRQFVAMVLDDLEAPVTAAQRGHLDTALRSVNQLRLMFDDLLETTHIPFSGHSGNATCIRASDGASD